MAQTFQHLQMGPKMSSVEVALQEEEKEKAKIQKAKSKASSAGATGDNSVKLMWMKHEGLRKNVFFCLQRVNDLR